MSFEISKEAEQDVEEIAQYTQQTWGNEQMAKYLRGLNNAFHFLAENPQINHEHQELNPPARIHHYKQHIILYVLTDESVLITRVLHQRMDIGTHYEKTNF